MGGGLHCNADGDAADIYSDLDTEGQQGWGPHMDCDTQDGRGPRGL